MEIAGRVVIYELFLLAVLYRIVNTEKIDTIVYGINYMIEQRESLKVDLQHDFTSRAERSTELNKMQVCPGLKPKLLKFKLCDIIYHNRKLLGMGANCTCGVRPLEQVKIVAGQLADEHVWPWAVALVDMTDPASPVQFCGSSLINAQYLLTAAHCASIIVQEGLRNFQAFLGINAISDPTAIKLNISQVKIHPNFNSTTLENDLALIKLNQPVVFSGRVHPICLKQAASPYVGLTGVVVGWGAVKQGGTGVDKLREVKVVVINNVDCATNYSAANIKITGPMMCASLSPKDSCQGDSGGPLMIWNPKSKIFCQMGIVSFGLKCGSPFYPGIYTRVNSFIKYIQSNTQDASYCQKSF